MINLYILQFNNYYNRTIRRYETIEEYRRYVLEVIPNINNFDFGDGINTSHIFPYKGKETPDYALITEEDESGNETIKSRWFVVESTFIRGNKFEIELRRDLIADNLDDVLDAPCMVEKGFVNNPLSDYSIFNSEGQNYNQIKQNEEQLYDKTKCPWIVGYFIPPKDAVDYYLKPTEIAISSEDTAIKLTSREQLPFWKYFENNPNKVEYKGFYSEDYMFLNLVSDANDSTSGNKYMRQFNSTNNYDYMVTNALGIEFSETGKLTDGWVYRDKLYLYETKAYEGGSVGQTALDKFFTSNAQYDIYNICKERMSEIFSSIAYNSDFFSPEDPQEIIDYYNGKTFLIDGKYYAVAVELLDGFVNVPVSIAQSDYIMYGLGNYYRNTSGELANKVCKINAGVNKIRIFYYEKPKLVNVSIEKNQYVQLRDAPYGMFCLPYSDELRIYSTSAEKEDFISNKDINIQVATSLSALLGDGVIKDLQLLPYCPIQENILSEYSNPSFSSLYLSKSYIKSGPILPDTAGAIEQPTVGYIYWCNVSNFDLTIPYKLTINNYKEESELNNYRLCSPGYKSVFEFNAAKNGGINGFHVDCTYKPYNPFILIHPNFDVLYGKNYEDNRGLICTDDFSLPIISDQWATYELNNKNYSNTFYREIQSAQLENKYAHYNDIANMFSGTVQAFGSGVLTGSPITTTATSFGAGLADVSINQKLRNDQIDKAETLFKYNLENIKARPQTVSKSSPIVKNNKQVPFLETYSCSNEEKEAFRAKIKYTGMTILKTSTLRSYLNYIDDVTESYVKGSIIRFPKIIEDFHYLKELSNEVGKGFYLGRENY